MKRPILALTVIFSLSACGQKHNDNVQAQPLGAPNSTLKNTEPACKTAADTSLDPERKVQRQTVNLKLEYQMVVHRACDGHEVKRGIEKVTLPSTEIVLQPTEATWSQWWQRVDGKIAGTVFNRTTCTDGGAGNTLGKLVLAPFYFPQMLADGMRSAAGYPRLRFTVNTSPTWLDMRVLRGQDNYLDYEFDNCPDATTPKSCSTVEKGTLILTVNYSEANLNGVKEVSDCTDPQKQNQPAKN